MEVGGGGENAKSAEALANNQSAVAAKPRDVRRPPLPFLSFFLSLFIWLSHDIVFSDGEKIPPKKKKYQFSYSFYCLFLYFFWAKEEEALMTQEKFSFLVVIIRDGEEEENGG